MERVVKKLAPLTSASKHISKYLNTNGKKTFYFAQIQSLLAYMMVIWYCTTNENRSRIEVAQNKAIKNIFGYPYDAHTADIYRDTELFNCRQLYEIQACKQIYKMEHKLTKTGTNLEKHTDVHHYYTRNANNYRIYGKTSRMLQSPLPQATKIFNNLNSLTKKSPTLSSFTKCIKKLHKQNN